MRLDRTATVFSSSNQGGLIGPSLFLRRVMMKTIFTFLSATLFLFLSYDCEAESSRDEPLSRDHWYKKFLTTWDEVDNYLYETHRLSLKFRPSTAEVEPATLEAGILRDEILNHLIKLLKAYLADDLVIRRHSHTEEYSGLEKLAEGLYTIVDGGRCIIFHQSWRDLQKLEPKNYKPKESYELLRNHYRKLQTCLTDSVKEALRTIAESFRSNPNLQVSRFEEETLTDMDEIIPGRFRFQFPSFEQVESKLNISGSGFFGSFTKKEKENFFQRTQVRFSSILSAQLEANFERIREMTDYYSHGDWPEFFPEPEFSSELLNLLSDYISETISRGGLDPKTEITALFEVRRNDLKKINEGCEEIFP